MEVHNLHIWNHMDFELDSTSFLCLVLWSMSHIWLWYHGYHLYQKPFSNTSWKWLIPFPTYWINKTIVETECIADGLTVVGIDDAWLHAGLRVIWQHYGRMWSSVWSTFRTITTIKFWADSEYLYNCLQWQVSYFCYEKSQILLILLWFIVYIL